MILKAANIKKIYPANKAVRRIIKAAKTAWIATFVQVQSFVERVTAAGGSYEDNGALESAVVNEVRNIPSLVVTPNAVAQGKLFSLYPDNGTGDFTVDRDSTATIVNAQGLSEVVPANTARIDYSKGGPALLIEPQATNLINYSENFVNGSWSTLGSTFEIIVGVNPDGSTSVFELTGDTQGKLQKTISGLSVNTTYTFSFYVKKTSYVTTAMSRILFLTSGVGGSNLGQLNYENALINDQWIRHTHTFTTHGTVSDYIVYCSNALPSGEKLQIWGAQLEEGSKATSYIPTNGSSVTRLVDFFHKTDIAHLIGSSEGYWLTDLKGLSTTTCRLTISKATDFPSQRFLLEGSSTYVQFSYWKDNVALFNGGSTYISDRKKICITYKEGSVKVAVNGAIVYTANPTGLQPEGVFDRITSGYGHSNFNMNAEYHRIQLGKTFLNDKQLIDLTTS